MAEKETHGIDVIHAKPVSDDSANVCPADRAINQNAVQHKIDTKYDKITQMFLARPANAANITEVNMPKQDASDRIAEEVKIRKVKKYDVSRPGNGPKDDGEERKIKAKYEAIAQMFLAQPATNQDEIGEGTKMKKIAKKRNESAIFPLDEKRDLDDAYRSTKAKKPNKNDKKMVKEEKQSKPTRLAGCFSFIIEWFSKKKQNRKVEKMKKKASKNRKESQ